jgi:(4-O-methyl)-D-glucuronate---lignin esterase
VKVLIPFLAALLALPGIGQARPTAPSSLESAWNNPPTSARLRAYWWWLNGNVTKASITRDLEQMKAKGFGGALICDAGGADQDGNAQVPHGPTFFSPAWRALFKHTLREAHRLGLVMGLNIQSGWNLGGPMVTPDDAPKKLVWTKLRFRGGTGLTPKLKRPKGRDNYYRDLFVLAYPIRHAPQLENRRPLENLQQKALFKALQPFSAPDSTPLFQEFPATPGEEDARVSDVIDLTSKLRPDGTLDWQAPPGDWEIFRLGCTLNDHCRVSTCSQGWNGYALDPFDAGAFKRYWNAVVEPLIADAGPLAGTTLKWLHTDSWEIDVANWTPTLRAEFRKRRGYDLLPWLPVLAGTIINSRSQSDRFLADFRRTMGDLAIANHFRLFKEGAHRHGLLIHPESGGPHGVPIDAQQCLGIDDAPMSEFWAWSWRHRIGDANRFFVKQPASAAHTYGHRLVLAEGFTSMGPHWQSRLWCNLKPAFDKACCEGLNRLVWHAFVCSPKAMGIPGQQYFAGTHLNPNVTWWNKSAPFFAYINRCQALLQRGLFVADVACYYGDHVPNFAQLKASDPAHVLPGYDYDVITAEALLKRASVRDRRLVLPDGMSYRVLALPSRRIISLPVLRKLKRLVAGGLTVIGPKPNQASGLSDYPRSDQEVQRMADEVWGPCDGINVKKHSFGQGRVISGETAGEVLAQEGVEPDCEIEPGGGVLPASFDYIHRHEESTEIYFVANRTNQPASATCIFRVSGKAPELWNPLTGQRQFARAYRQEGRRTAVPLDFTPCGSWFVVFRSPASSHPAVATRNGATFIPVMRIHGPWQVAFDPKWGGPAKARFDHLASWTVRAEPGIKYYSGTAIYRRPLNVPAKLVVEARAKTLALDLGDVRELAEVRLNGKSCGITWSPPFCVDLSRAVKPGENNLEIEVVNFWPNRIIGDQFLPAAERFTKTNIRKLTKDTPLMQSGLLGPVRLGLLVKNGNPFRTRSSPGVHSPR